MHLTDDEVDRLVDELARPIYVYRMARAMDPSMVAARGQTDRMARSAHTRLQNARQEIREIVFRYGALAE